MSSKVLLLAVILASLWCAWAVQAQAPSSGYSNSPLISSLQGVPRDSATAYFPASAIINPDRIQPGDTSHRVSTGQRMDCGYPLAFASQALFAAKVPVLSNYFLGAAVYRFTWLRAFHRPAFLTLTCTAEGATLRAQLLNKPPGMVVPGFLDPDEPGLADKIRKSRRNYQEEMARDKRWLAQVAFAKAPVVVMRDETVALTPAQVEQFRTLLNTTGFWTEPSCQPRMILDGAYWMLEAHEQKRYHPVFRHSPDAGESLRRCCDFLLDLSSLKKERRY